MVKVQKKIWLIIIGIIVTGIVCPIILEHFIFRNKFYSVIDNKDWASFLGSFIGGIIGGIGTLLAVYITVTETRDIQEKTDNKIEEDRKALRLKENKVFTDEIVSIIAKYITDISQYFYFGRTHNRLDRELKELNREWNDLEREKIKLIENKKNLKIEIQTDEFIEIDTDVEQTESKIIKIKEDIRYKSEECERYSYNRKVAVECFYLLNIKLEKIELSKTLIDKLKYIHELSACDHENIDYKVFEKGIEELQKITKEFVDKYIIS